jgi:hypothetical protein
MAERALMKELFFAQALLTEDEFHRQIRKKTAAIAIDMSSGRIIHATEEAHGMFECQVQNGLINLPYERLIPSELREKHLKHVGLYEKDPQVRDMRGAEPELRAVTFDQKKNFDVRIKLIPIQKGDRMFMVLIFNLRKRE